jgi:hypothetical protein
MYLQAFEHYQEPDKSLLPYLPMQGEYEIIENNIPLPDEVINAITITLDSNKKTLELLDQGATIKDCVFPRERPLDMNNQELFVNIKNCGWLISERNLYLAQTHQTDELFVAIPTLLGFSKSPIKQGMLIDELITIALKNMAAENLENTLNKVTFSDSQLAYLQKQFSEIQDLEACCRGLIKERIYFFESVLSPYNERPEKPTKSNRQRERIHSMVGLMQKEYTMYLDYLQRCIDAAQLPLYDRPKEFNSILLDLFNDLSWQIYLDSIAKIIKVTDIDMRVIGFLRCAETALAIERYRLKYGIVPEILEDLVPEFMGTVPLEPFDGEPLRYILLEDGYTLYTIGDDWEDNGGLSKEQMSEKTGEEIPEEYDWPFTVRRKI